MAERLYTKSGKRIAIIHRNIDLDEAHEIICRQAEELRNCRAKYTKAKFSLRRLSIKYNTLADKYNEFADMRRRNDFKKIQGRRKSNP